MAIDKENLQPELREALERGEAVLKDVDQTVQRLISDKPLMLLGGTLLAGFVAGRIFGKEAVAVAPNEAIEEPGEAVKELRRQGQEAARLGREFQRATGDTVDDLALASRLQLKRSPYLTLGATFGVGFVLGGGVPLRLLGVAAALGGRLAASMALRELTAALLKPGGPNPQASGLEAEPGAD